MIQALIFDFDGLILDTETPLFQSWQELFSQYNCQLSLATWSETIGTAEVIYDPFVELEKQLGSPLDREALATKRLAREIALINAQPIMPGVKEYLLQANALGLKIGLASSSSRQWVTSHLERLGLIGYFNCIRASDDVAVTKPDPALYRAVLAQLKLAPQEALALEDSPNGVLAAKQAGLFCVAIPNPLTSHLSLSHADLILPSLVGYSLETLLQEVNKRRDGHPKGDN